MKYFKKLLITLLAAVGTVCLAAGFVACGNNNGDGEGNIGGGLVPLIAPKDVEINDNVLTWKAVTYAEGYAVYENGEIVSEQTETSYTIEQTTPGTYKYAVKATTTADGRTDSPLSAEVEYKVPTIKLAAPVISIDQATATISWVAVANASGYDIYEGGTRVDSTTNTRYEITNKSVPQDLTYTVRATTTNIKMYSTSDHSEPVTYRVPLYATISVEFPDEFAGGIKVAIFDLNSDSQEPIAEETVVRDENIYDEEGEVGDGYSSFGSAHFKLEWGRYMAKVTDGLSDQYVATWARISTDRRSGTISIIEKTENVMVLGSNTVDADLAADDESVTLQYFFVAGASNDKAHSIIVDEGYYGLQVTVAGKVVVNTNQRLFKGSFSTEEGEVVIITVTVERQTIIGAEHNSFEIEIVDYEERTPLRILPEPFDIDRFVSANYENYVNAIYDSCVCTLEVKTAGTYEFFILSGMAGNTFITLTVNGEEFDLSGGGKAVVHLEETDNLRVQIDLINLPSAALSLFVYMV